MPGRLSVSSANTLFDGDDTGGGKMTLAESSDLWSESFT
jgi:hypothetical protein